MEALPALWTDVGPRTAHVRFDYGQSVTELFVDSFMKPVAEFCKTQGVKLSLEVPSMRNVVQGHADIPGIDPGHDKVGAPLDDILARELPSYRGNLSFPASLAAQTGRNRVLDELFHSVGWSLTLQDMKAMLDRAAARGANLFAFHAFCYLIGGLRKWDAPPSEFEQNPYWPYFHLLSGYAGRLAYALSQGRRTAPIAVLDPITSIWAHTSELGRDLVAQCIVGDWTTLMRELTASQRPHDNLDALLLAEAAVQGGRLILADAEYQAVVLPSLTNLERASCEKLDEFVASGGLVVATGTLPNEDIETGSDDLSRSRVAFGADSQRGFVMVHGVAEVLRVLEDRVPADIRLVPAQPEFLLAQRRGGDTDVFFVANSSMEVRACELILRRSQSRVTRLDFETGDSEELAHSNGRLVLEFPRHGAHLLLVEKLAAATAPSPALRATSPRGRGEAFDLDLGDVWECELPEDQLNCLRLDRFHFTTDDFSEGPVLEPKPLSECPPGLDPITARLARHADRQTTLRCATERRTSTARRRSAVTRLSILKPPRGLSADLRFRVLALPTTAWYEATFEARHLPTTAHLKRGTSRRRSSCASKTTPSLATMSSGSMARASRPLPSRRTDGGASTTARWISPID